MTDKPQGAPQNPNPDYQDRDILLKPVVFFVVALAVVTIATVIAMGIYFRVMDDRAWKAEADIPAAARERVLPPAPRLLVDEPMELKAYLENARSILESYAVLDEDEGIVRLPVDVALDLVVEQGLPDWSPPVPEVTNSEEAESEADQETTDDSDATDTL